jgi:predicted DNA-binding transcriptional regulator AlpA
VGGVSISAIAERRDPIMAQPGRPRSAVQLLTVEDVCGELDISRSTFYDWRLKGRAPRCYKLPNGDLRIRRRDLDEWFESLEMGVG